MKTTTTIWKIPTTDFTHTEMAQLNDTTNQAVWAEYKRLRDEGFIVSAGVRASGKGKPTGVWKVADGHTIVTDATAAKQPAPRVKRETVKPVVEVVDVPKEELQKTLDAVSENQTKIVSSMFPVTDETKSLIAEVDKALPSVVPTTTPVVEVVEEIQPVRMVRNLTCQVVEIEEKCPFCQTKLLSVETAEGVRVWCGVNDLKICSCSENPYGASNNIKNAIEILHDKFFKHRSPAKA